MVASSPPDHRLEFDLATLKRFGGAYAPALRDGDWWRLVTAAFVHGSPEHIAWNMISLFFLGIYLEPRYAPLRYISVYLACGIASSAASAAWYWSTDLVQVGASGAISGLVGAGAVSAWHMGARGRVFRNSMIVWAIVVIVNGFAYSANNVAHAAGLVTGAIAVAIFGRRGRAALSSREVGRSLDDAQGAACPGCGAANPAGSRFCGRCGGGLELSPAPP